MRGGQPRWPMSVAIVFAGLIMAVANREAMTPLTWLFLLLGAGILAASAFTDRRGVLAGAIVLSAMALALIPIATGGSVVSLGILPILAGGVLGQQLAQKRQKRE